MIPMVSWLLERARILTHIYLTPKPKLNYYNLAS
jgi:hypothetical protein